MSKLEDQLEEDRALRNSARKLFRSELEHVRNETTAKAIGEKVAGEIGERADAASDKAIDFAQDHKRSLIGIGAALVSGAALWLARKPIASALSGDTAKCENENGEEGGESLDEDTGDE